MASNTLTVKFHLEGYKETLAAFRELPKDASKSLREQTLKLSEALAEGIKEAARRDVSPQAELLIPTVRARKDRVPNIRAGGVKRVGSNKVPAYKVLFGAEFGSDRFKQFHKPHNGTEGSWFFQSVERDQDQISQAWRTVANDIVSAFTQGSY